MISTADIERIVREVIAGLEEPRQGSASTEPTEPTALPKSPVGGLAIRPEACTPAVANRPAELAIASRLITLSEIDGRLAGVRRLIVQPGTIITPAVKEEIAKRNIQVIVGTAAAGNAGKLKLSVVAARTKFDPSPIAAAMQNEQVEVELHSSKCLIETADLMAGEVKKSAMLGLILTPYEAETLCLANRKNGVRAVLGREAAQVASDAAAVGANVLVVNPKRTGPYALRQILTAFCRGGVRPCPEVLRKVLG